MPPPVTMVTRRPGRAPGPRAGPLFEKTEAVRPHKRRKSAVSGYERPVLGLFRLLKYY
jgi:hypothetical protein